VRDHRGHEGHDLAEDAAADLVEVVRGGVGLRGVAARVGEAGVEGRVDDAKVVGQEVERGREVAPQPGAVRQRLGEDSPEEGDGAAAGDAREAVGCEEVDAGGWLVGDGGGVGVRWGCGLRVVPLARLLGAFEADGADLELVPDDEDLGDDDDDDGRDEPRELEHEVVVDKGEEPEEHDDAGFLLVDNVPYDIGEDHGDDGAANSAEEAKEGLAGRYGQLASWEMQKTAQWRDSLMVMPMATMIKAHTSRCSW